jgi:hypothetical protein
VEMLVQNQMLWLIPQMRKSCGQKSFIILGTVPDSGGVRVYLRREPVAALSDRRGRRERDGDGAGAGGKLERFWEER